MNFIHGNGIRKSSMDADSVSPLNSKGQFLAQQLLCVKVFGFFFPFNL